jgi:replicative DNA helicase
VELEISVLALSQLTRANARESRPPELTDLRDSGNIEQDANKVLMLHWPNGDQPGEVAVDCYLRKNRGGPKGKLELRFQPWTQRWREVGMPTAPEPLQEALGVGV